MKYKWFPGSGTKVHAVSYKGKASWLTRLTYNARTENYTAHCEHGMITACGKSIWCSPKEVKRSYKPEDKCKACLKIIENK